MQDPYNGKVLLAAVICLSVVVLFVILLHIYGRWLLHRSRASTTTNGTVLTDFHRRSRSSVDETAAGFSLRDVGLDSAAVAALPLFVYSEEERDGRVVDCVVCLSKMEEGEKGRILPRCGHGFHVCCIDVWLRANSSCPICRTPVASVVRGEEEEEGEGCEVVVVEADEGAEEVSDMVVVMVVEMDEGDQKEEGSSSSSSSSSSSVISGSLRRMLSRSRSDKRVFPSVNDN